VQVAADKFSATATTVTDARRQKLWDIMAEIWPPYIEYQQKTDRHIPCGSAYAQLNSLVGASVDVVSILVWRRLLY
jgi:hypothetical protein